MAGRRPPRVLGPEEEALWKDVTAKTTPLHPDRPVTPARPKPPAKLPEPKRAQAKTFKIGQTAKPQPQRREVSPGIGDTLRKAPVQMDKKAFGRMTKGKLSPDARIDLHGMTMAAAHPALIGFIQSAHARGDRLVLVITGKGKVKDDGGPIPVPKGVLKHQVPQWLKSGPLRHAVLQITEAHVRHGGSGAYYVYLRRAR